MRLHFTVLQVNSFPDRLWDGALSCSVTPFDRALSARDGGVSRLTEGQGNFETSFVLDLRDFRTLIAIRKFSIFFSYDIHMFSRAMHNSRSV